MTLKQIVFLGNASNLIVFLIRLTNVHHPPLRCKGYDNVLCHTRKCCNYTNSSVLQLEFNTQEGNERDIGQCAHYYGYWSIYSVFILSPVKLQASVEVIYRTSHWNDLNPIMLGNFLCILFILVWFLQFADTLRIHAVMSMSSTTLMLSGRAFIAVEKILLMWAKLRRFFGCCSGSEPRSEVAASVMYLGCALGPLVSLTNIMM